MSQNKQVTTLPTGNIKLHNCIVDSSLELDVWDIRLLNSTLAGKDQGSLWNQKQVHGVDMVIFEKLSNLLEHPGEAYNRALASAKKLQSTSLTITLPDKTKLITSLVFEVKYDEGLKSILIHWNKDFIPLISGQMPVGKFMFPSISMAGTRSSKRYALYLLIEKNLWRLNKEESFSLSRKEIREVIGLKPDTYLRWNSITSRIIVPTIEEIYDTIAVSLDILTTKNDVVFSLKGRLV